jgi:hypothetical protein
VSSAREGQAASTYRIGSTVMSGLCLRQRRKKATCKCEGLATARAGRGTRCLTYTDRYDTRRSSSQPMGGQQYTSPTAGQQYIFPKPTSLSSSAKPQAQQCAPAAGPRACFAPNQPPCGDIGGKQASVRCSGRTDVCALTLCAHVAHRHLLTLSCLDLSCACAAQ